jgi:NAD(P)-dependent dehydrogenase (short-subunit alcohol dehydrogenase family)
VVDRMVAERHGIDILVNNVWGGYERMVEGGTFTWPKPFWEQPLWRWDAMFSAGVRAYYQASQLAAPAMIARRRGLIVNISFWGHRSTSAMSPMAYRRRRRTR